MQPWFAGGVAVLLLTMAPLAATAAQPPAVPKAAPAPQASIAVPPPASIPRSVFIVPKTPEEGKDPFFPHSLQVYSALTNRAGQVAPAVKAVVIELRLSGLSGTPANPLAIINGQTFGVGEEHDLLSGPGTNRLHVRCLEINADSATVEYNSERHELRMRRGF